MKLPFHRICLLLIATCLMGLASCDVKPFATVVPPATLPAVATSTTHPSSETQQSTTGIESQHCDFSQGEVLDEEMPSKLLARPLAVKIYLPPCYAKNREKGYPVLYMLHGQTYLNDQWRRLGLLTAADEFITAGIIIPMIIVMPYEVSWSATPEESSFDESFLQELLPYIDGKFNTCSERTCRAVGGLSRGGNWAIYLGFSHPEKVTAIGAHSAPLFYGEIQRMTAVLKTTGAVAKLPAIYMDVGNSDENLHQVMTYVDLLKKNNVPYQFTEFQGYHSEDYWRAHVNDYLIWYSAQFTAGN